MYLQFRSFMKKKAQKKLKQSKYIQIKVGM